MKTYWGAEVQLHAFFISALDGVVWIASRSLSLYRRDKSFRYPLDKRQAAAPAGNWTPVVQPIV